MKTGRKISGGKYHKSRKKKLFERHGQGIAVILGDVKRKQITGRGGNKRTVLLKANIANVKTSSSIKKAEIKNVIETPQNRFLARQNRLLKGAIIETSLGKARITNRPSREGCINAILIE